MPRLNHMDHPNGPGDDKVVDCGIASGFLNAGTGEEKTSLFYTPCKTCRAYQHDIRRIWRGIGDGLQEQVLLAGCSPT